MKNSLAIAFASALLLPSIFTPVGSQASSATKAAFTVAQTSQPYRVGQRVEYVDFGTWYKAVVVQVRNDARPYLVHPIGYITTMDRWVPITDMRAAGSGTTSPIPGGAAGEANDEVLKSMRAASGVQGGVAPGGAGSAARNVSGGVAVKSYHCVMFIVNHLADAAPFTINAGQRYTDRNGVHGTYTYAGGIMTFHGANYDGQRAEYETSNGRPNVHFISPSGRKRGVIDCD
ncbi:MAG: hypothetical protein NVS2B17_24900 [Candidatus Velthaea sp.]